MTAAEPFIVAASQAFDTAAKGANLHLIHQTTTVGGIVSSAEMEAVYTGRMVPEESPGRAIYDVLLMAASGDFCPLCGHGLVKTLDHVLPKTKYPALAVAPLNLVPCCSDCNKSKTNIPPSEKENQFLHPYYDSIEDDPWLSCELIEADPPGARFFVEPFSDWDSVMASRVCNQFKTLELGKLYASQAGRELSNLRLQLTRL